MKSTCFNLSNVQVTHNCCFYVLLLFFVIWVLLLRYLSFMVQRITPSRLFEYGWVLGLSNFSKEKIESGKLLFETKELILVYVQSVSSNFCWPYYDNLRVTQRLKPIWFRATGEYLILQFIWLFLLNIINHV